MPDISMCDNEECPIKNKCYRYTAIPNDIQQSYTTFKPSNNRCAAYIKNKKE